MSKNDFSVGIVIELIQIKFGFLIEEESDNRSIYVINDPSSYVYSGDSKTYAPNACGISGIDTAGGTATLTMDTIRDENGDVGCIFNGFKDLVNSGETPVNIIAETLSLCGARVTRTLLINGYLTEKQKYVINQLTEYTHEHAIFSLVTDVSTSSNLFPKRIATQTEFPALGLE